MEYQLIKEVVNLMEEFESKTDFSKYTKDLAGFKRWIADGELQRGEVYHAVDWVGKEKGRTPESVISTLITHMNRYAKTYSRSAIHDSEFSTQEDFIYLITLQAFGPMSKTDLIKKNIHEKPVGMQIINRLIKQGWIQQSDSETDKRSKIILITNEGLAALEQSMDKIRQATKLVTANLSANEKTQLIALLQKLDDFHHAIYAKNLEPSQLLTTAQEEYLQANR